MHGFDTPPFLHEPPCQPVEQFRMTWGFGSQTEIARRPHQASAEVMLPNAIYHHARGQWVLGVRNGAGKFKAAIAVLEGLPFRTGEHLKKLARHFLPEAR